MEILFGILRAVGSVLLELIWILPFFLDQQKKDNT